jgi:Tol biopolymer transport system component
MLLDMEGVLQWTPDGSGVVYVETDGGVSNLYAQPVNRGTPHALTNFTEDHIIYFAWSSDWKRLP